MRSTRTTARARPEPDVPSRTPPTGAMRGYRLIYPAKRPLEQHGHERVDIGEPDPVVGGAGPHVVVVDVQRHGRRDAAQRLADHAGHTVVGEAPATQVGGDPDALHLAGIRRDGADLGLEDHDAVVDAGEGAPGPDEFGHPGPVEDPAVTRGR